MGKERMIKYFMNKKRKGRGDGIVFEWMEGLDRMGRKDWIGRNGRDG